MKLNQLRLASALGFEIPATLVTTDPDNALTFWNACDGRLISKALVTSAFSQSGLSSRFLRFTEPVTARDIRALDRVRVAPAILQPMVTKRRELRVTVVGEKVFAVGSRNHRTTSS